MTYKSIFFYCFCSTAFLLIACSRNLYRKAIIESSHPSPDKVSANLTAISNNNKTLYWNSIKNKDSVSENYVLVATWKKNTTYYFNDSTGFFNTKNYPLFVTVCPDLQLWFEKQRHRGEADKRLRQLLGLPPNVHYTAFVLFWVRPQDVLRPCLDTEITDNTCEFVIDDKSKFSQNCDNLLWLANYTRSSYSDHNLYNCYPFTQLGYTYDWNRRNKKHVGMSEFVIGKNKLVKVAGIYETNQFFKLFYKRFGTNKN